MFQSLHRDTRAAGVWGACRRWFQYTFQDYFFGGAIWRFKVVHCHGETSRFAASPSLDQQLIGYTETR